MSRHKRRKTEHIDSAIRDAVPEVAAHIDTEINMRARLAQTLQARIEWALALKTVLERGGLSISLIIALSAYIFQAGDYVRHPKTSSNSPRRP